MCHAMEDGKGAMRALAMMDRSSSDYTPQERQDLITYCRTDVDPYVELLPRILDTLERLNYPWGRFLSYGRFTEVCAQMTRRGIPVNFPLWQKIKGKRSEKYVLL